jgi:hypothetical protein
MSIYYDKQKHFNYIQPRMQMMAASAGLEYSTIDINNYKEIRDSLNQMLVAPELYRKKVELRAILYHSLLVNGSN